VGRRASYLLGTVTLAVSTALYVALWHLRSPFWQWAVVSVLLGLGFTFFSGAVEAWLVDALHATAFTGELEAVFGRGQVVSGVAMLTGSVAGGYIAQATSLGVPFVLRAGVLAVMFVVAWRLMHDIGFTPRRGAGVRSDVAAIAQASVRYGWRVPAVKWLMLASPFTMGVGIYGFYALQPYLLEIHGDPEAYGIAGLAAAIVAGSQIAGGLSAPLVARLFTRRTTALAVLTAAGACALALIGVARQLWAVIALVVVWGLVSAASRPVRQTFINALIPSQQRATILSFDSLVGSAGGVVAQPVLGRVADVWSYAASYVVSALLTALATPFLLLSRRERVPADRMDPEPSGEDPVDLRQVAVGDVEAAHRGDVLLELGDAARTDEH
jgi:MFS family permease